MLHGTLIAPDESQFAGAPSKFAGLTTGTAPATGDIVVIPDAFLLFNCEFKRVGDDLKLVGADGRTHMVADYFKGDTHPTLATAQGAQIPGSVIDALAGSQAPGQYAQAGAQPGTAEAIGKVATATGNATIVRNGVAVAVNSGDVVLKNDVMRTGGDGALGVTFNDGTTFSLSANAQMAVNDFVYQDGGSNNQAVFNLVRGSISFFASQVAKTGDMKVTTPTATMGIRGTTVVVDIVVDTVNPTSIGQVKIKLYADSNGNVGRVEVSTIGGAPLGVLTATATGFVITPAGAQPNVQQEQVSQQEAARDMALLQALFNSTDIGNQLLQQQGGPQDPNNPNPNTNGSNGSSTDPNVIITVNQTQNGDGTTTTTVAGVTINPPGNASPGSEGGGITPDTSTPTPAPTPIVVDTTNTPPVTITHLTTAQDSNSVAESGVWFGNFPWHGDPVATGNVLANDEDLFPGEAGLHVTTIAAAQGPSTAVHSSFGTVIQGKYGFLWMRPDGSYVYTLNNNDPDTQGLNFGEKGTDVFTYTVMDEDGHYATETLAIDVHGANDAPVIFGGVSTGLVIEDGIGWQGEARGNPTASGTLYKFDVDNNDDATNDSWSVMRGYGQTLNQDGSVTGRYGRLEVNDNGQWTYTLDDCDPDTQGLGLGQTGYEIFTIKVTDQYGASDTQTIRVTVRGSNEAPQPNQAPTADGGELPSQPEDQGFAVLLTGSDEDGSVTRFAIDGQPQHGKFYGGSDFSSQMSNSDLQN
ncbi:MAG: VCBS domain-containing protein, partial [Dehalococcoidia bacterium]